MNAPFVRNPDQQPKISGPGIPWAELAKREGHRSAAPEKKPGVHYSILSVDEISQRIMAYMQKKNPVLQSELHNRVTGSRVSVIAALKMLSEKGKLKQDKTGKAYSWSLVDGE
ncbi:MAG: hypothetical protein ACRC0L_08925 [Angustibacter sp.]